MPRLAESDVVAGQVGGVAVSTKAQLGAALGKAHAAGGAVAFVFLTQVRSASTYMYCCRPENERGLTVWLGCGSAAAGGGRGDGQRGPERE